MEEVVDGTRRAIVVECKRTGPAEECAEKPLHEKATENTPLVGGGVVATLLVIIRLLVVGGVIEALVPLRRRTDECTAL